MILILGDLYINEELKQEFENLDEKVVYIREPYEHIENIIADSDYICACNFNLDKYINYLNPNQCIIMAETGVVNINLDKAKEMNLNVLNLENYSCDAVIQYIIYCIINKLRPWNLYFKGQNNKKDIITRESIGLETLKIGILGYGTIGRALHNILDSFNCEVLITSRRKSIIQNDKYVTVEALFKEANVVVITCDLNNTSREMIDYKLLSYMKKNSSIISISQNKVFKINDLYKFLRNRLDVEAYLDFDFNKDIENMNKLKNVHISPHTAFFTQQTIINRTKACINKIKTNNDNKARRLRFVE